VGGILFLKRAPGTLAWIFHVEYSHLTISKFKRSYITVHRKGWQVMCL